MLLYIDACLNRTTSRTERLAQAYLAKRQEASPCEIQTVILEEESLKPLDAVSLAQREAFIAQKDYSHEIFRLARLLVKADELLIAAPYWDMSFPASVKLFLEQICINGLTFRYNKKGIPEGMTAIKQLTYVTTSGGYIGPFNFGYEYVKGLFQNLLGVPQVRFISAEGLDIYGNTVDQILRQTIQTL